MASSFFRGGRTTNPCVVLLCSHRAKSPTLAEFSAEEATLHGVLDPPNHLRNHAKLPHSSLDSQDKQGNSFPAELINSKTFAESSSFICFSCFSNSPAIQSQLT